MPAISPPSPTTRNKQLITELRAYISDTPVILSIEDGSGRVTQLKDGNSYTLNGVNLGSTPGDIYIGGTQQTVTKPWGDSVATFTAVKPTAGNGGPAILVTGGSNPQTAESASPYLFS